jgi:hypothetical protein
MKKIKDWLWWHAPNIFLGIVIFALNISIWTNAAEHKRTKETLAEALKEAHVADSCYKENQKVLESHLKICPFILNPKGR